MPTVTLVLMAMVAVGVMRRFGSATNLVHYLQGHEVSVRVVSEAGPAIEVRNLGHGPLTVRQGTISCQCARLDGLPLSVPPGDLAVIRLANGSPSTESTKVPFLVEHDGGLEALAVWVSSER